MTSTPPTAARPLWLKLLLGIPLSALGLIITAFGAVYVWALITATSVRSTPITAQTTRFDGRYLLAASDADMVGTAYGDSWLRQVPGDVDTLTLVELPVVDSDPRLYEIPASNSVTSWPQITAVAADGSFAYVIETAQPAPDDVEYLPVREKGPGRLLTAVDLRAGAGAATVTTVEVGRGAVHVAISTDDRHLAVGLTEAGRQLAIVPTATLTEPDTFTFFSIQSADGQPAREVSSVNWHPSGEFLALGVNAEEIHFYRLSREAGGALSLNPHGQPITGGHALTYGQFTADGRHYLVSEINWRRYPAPWDTLLNGPSEMVSIRFDASDAARHVEVARVPVGLSAEGFAISEQEDLIVTVNMQRTYVPDMLAWWPGAQLNSLSLLAFDVESGALTRLGEPYGFEGVLPEDAMFDADGDSLGVVIYNDRANPMGPGAIEFWNVVRDGPEPRLERTGVRVDVVRGPHAMNFIP